MESMIGKEIYANYGAMHSEHYGLVVGYKTTTIREESVKEYKVWWFERGEDSGETSWVPECTIRTEGETSANGCLLYTSPSPRDRSLSRMPSSA